MTTSWSRGMSTSMFLRLCSRAPLMRMNFELMNRLTGVMHRASTAEQSSNGSLYAAPSTAGRTGCTICLFNSRSNACWRRQFCRADRFRQRRETRRRERRSPCFPSAARRPPICARRSASPSAPSSTATARTSRSTARPCRTPSATKYSTPRRRVKVLQPIAKDLDAQILIWGDVSAGKEIHLRVFDLLQPDPLPHEITKRINQPTDMRFRRRRDPANASGCKAVYPSQRAIRPA